MTGRVDDLENQVTQLEELCRQMNTDIAALQTIVDVLQDNDCVTDVVPVVEGTTIIGYTLRFLHHAPITIYHGEKSEKGEKGDKGDEGLKRERMLRHPVR